MVSELFLSLSGVYLALTRYETYIIFVLQNRVLVLTLAHGTRFGVSSPHLLQKKEPSVSLGVKYS